MKAIISIADDDGNIIEKEKVVCPYSVIVNADEDKVPTKTMYFNFAITMCLESVKKNRISAE